MTIPSHFSGIFWKAFIVQIVAIFIIVVIFQYYLCNQLLFPCCEVWDTIGVTLSDRLQKLQNRAARVITGRKNEHGQSELALNELNFKTLKERRT